MLTTETVPNVTGHHFLMFLYQVIFRYQTRVLQQKIFFLLCRPILAVA